MLYGAQPVRGEEAHAIGLVDRLVPAGEERAAALELAAEIAAAAPLAVRSMRRTMRADLLDRVEAALQQELDQQEWLWRTEDCATGITSSLNREQPTFLGR
jgi:enoyl-CoA hydratase/carnithine racemase